MNTYVVKYQSFNRANYSEMVSAKNEKDAFKAAQKMVVKHDDRDVILSVTEHNELNTYNTLGK